MRWAIYVCPEHPDLPIGCTLDEPAPDCGEHVPPTGPPMRRIEVSPTLRERLRRWWPW